MAGDWYKHRYVQKNIPAISDVISSIASFLMVCFVIQGLNKRIANREDDDDNSVQSFRPTDLPANDFLHFNSDLSVSPHILHQLRAGMQSNHNYSSYHDINSVASDPTLEPTFEPTFEPSSAPSLAPSVEPTLAPSVEPTLAPSVEPTLAPTRPTRPTPRPTPFVAQYVANRSRFYLNIWVIAEFCTMFVTFRSRYISNWISMPTDTRARFKIQSEGLLLKAIQVVLQCFTFIATAGFMGEQLRNDHSLDNPSPFVSTRLCLYVASILFWIVLAGGLACYIYVISKDILNMFAALIYIPSVALAAAMQTFFYPYIVLVMMLMHCFFPNTTEKILLYRRLAWNDHPFRNMPIIFIFCGSLCFGWEGMCAGMYVIFCAMGPGILYDGVYVSQMVIPPLLIIMFFSSFAMVTRIAPESITTVCEPLLGRAGAILLLLVKIIQVCCSIILYLVRIIAHRDMRKVGQLYAELVELHEEYLFLELFKILFRLLEDFNRSSAGNNNNNEARQGARDISFVQLTNKIEELQAECLQKQAKLANDLVNIWNRLEGYDEEADKDQRKVAIKGVKEIVKGI